jgi:U32 family peptidase
VVCTPRVIKPDERQLWLFYLRLGADALLVRSAGLLYTLNQLGGTGAAVKDCEHAVPSIECDFSINVANVVAADLMLSSSNVARLSPTHDLNATQLIELGKNLGARANRLEAIVHLHIPIFYTEHCVFCRFLSTGNSFKDCGRPCERHTVHIRDESNRDLLVLADEGCRNTIFNAEAQSALPFIGGLVDAGICLLTVGCA